MPRLQDIERFKRDLAALSHEAEVLERWGEKPGVVTPLEGAAAASGKTAPGRAAAEAPRSPKALAIDETQSADDEGLPPDFAALLDNLPIDNEKASSVDDDLAALLGPSEEEGAPSEASEIEAEEQAVSAEPSPLDFAMPDFDTQSAEGDTQSAEGDTQSAEGDTQSAEGDTQSAEGDTQSAEGDTQSAEGDTQSAEGDTQSAEGDTQSAEGEEALESMLPLDEEPFAMAMEPALESDLLESVESEAAPTEDFALPEFDLVDDGNAVEGAQSSPSSAAFEEDFSIPDLGASLEGDKGAEAPSPARRPRKAPSAPEEELSLGGTELGEDAFESFSFEEPGAGDGFGGAASDLRNRAGQDLDTEIASLSEEAPIADTFKIDQDWGGFGSLGTEGGNAMQPRQAPPKASPPRSNEEKFKPVNLNEAQVDRLQDSLLSFPLNLRVAIEDILANDRGSEAQQSKLVWALVDGAAAEDAAVLAGRVLKRHIPIPKGREKRTGAALEAEKGTFAYAFVHTFLPVMRIGILVLAAAAALGYLGWRFVYVPLAADSLYRTGYQRIAEDRYPEAETDFAKATQMREFIPWYYRYAESYAAKRQYILAEKKYASLIEAHPKEKKGILAWARLEKEQLKFEEAVEVLKGAPRSSKAGTDATRGMTGLLSWDYFNEQGLLLLGDVYLDWAEEAPAEYENARRTYATLLEHFGDSDIYLERMLLYFIRIDRLSEVLPLKLHFLADPKRAALNAEVLAELGGYLLDKGMIDDVRDILLTAAKKDPAVPESHYNLARYFHRAGDPTEERKALDNAVLTFAALPGLGGRRAGMYIDSLIWRGRFLVQAKEWLGAERDYATAASEYEKALELRRVKKGARFGEAYAGLADVAYWQRDDLASALALYERAADNGYTTADTSYKRGNILYRTGRYQESLEHFFEAGAGSSMSPYLAYAFGSALYARNDLFSAEAYYRRASSAMEKELASVGEPAPQERPSEIEILKLYMKSENNLGVALYRSAARSGDSRRRIEAMAALTHSVQLYDQLAQAPAAFEGSESRNFGLENINTLLQKGRGENLLVYAEIEKDMKFPKNG